MKDACVPEGMLFLPSPRPNSLASVTRPAEKSNIEPMPLMIYPEGGPWVAVTVFSLQSIHGYHSLLQLISFFFLSSALLLLFRS